MGKLGIAYNPDAVIIGALMLLVPGLLFTNAMRGIIYGDINSGTTRIFQVFLIAAAIALGTATAWNISISLWGAHPETADASYPFLLQAIACFIGCVGFSIIFNIHGPGGLLCALGGLFAWATYIILVDLGASDILAYFWAAVLSSAYSEIMARIRKYPAISYLVVSIFPLLPGAGIYYTVSFALKNQMELALDKGLQTVSIAGVMAVGILLVSTVVRLWNNWKSTRK